MRLALSALLLLSLFATAQNPPKSAAPPAQKPAAPPATAAPSATQSAPPATTQPAPPAQPATPSVSPDAAVITIDGLCANAPPNAPKPAPTAGCTTTVSRADFEKLTQALDANMPRATQAQLAEAYARALVMQDAARKRGVENDPRSQEVLRFMRMQIVAQLLNRELQNASRDVTDAQADEYFRAHADQFDQVKLQRLFVPKNPPPTAKKLSDAERIKLITDSCARAKAEDMDKIEKDLYAALGLSTAPPADVGLVRRQFLPEEHQKAIYAVKAGEVTPVISDSVGEYCYKVISHQPLTAEAVRNEIKAQLQQQRYKEQLDAIMSGVKTQLNPAYFGASTGLGAEREGREEVQMPQGPRTVKPPPQ